MALSPKHLPLLISGLRLRERDYAEDWFSAKLHNISVGVEAGIWSEEKNPEEFAELRRVLAEAKPWVLSIPELVTMLAAARDVFPSSFWWLDVEKW